MPYYIQKPQVLFAIEWTGANLAAVDEWCEANAPWFRPLDTEGVTLILNPNSGGWSPLDPGGFITISNPMPAESMAYYQEVPALETVYATESEA